MKHFIQLYIIIVMVTVACHQPDFDSMLDPASENYIPPVPSIVETKVPRVLVTDFEGDTVSSIWGYQHSTNVESNSMLTPTYINEASVENIISRVMGLHYDVSDNDSSLAYWLQPLGSDNEGTFNAKTMCLKSLTFYARGAVGGEMFLVTLTDKDGNNTENCDDCKIRTLTTNWRQYRIPLSSLSVLSNGTLDLQRLGSLDITFDPDVGPPKGTIFVDEFAFEWEL